MRLLILLLSLLAVVLSNRVTFEDLDIDKLLSRDDQRNAAFACLMDQGPCGEMQALRDTIPHLIKTKCGDCNPKQKQKYEYVSKVLLEKYPEKFNALTLKYAATTH